MIWSILRQEARRFFKTNRVLALSGIAILGGGLGTSSLVLACLLTLNSPILPGMHVLSYATIAEAVQGGGSERIPWERYERILASAKPGVHLAAYSRSSEVSAHAAGRELRMHVAAVSQGFWGTFTNPLTAGRDLLKNEESGCRPRVLLVSSEAAARLFASPSEALGQLITLNGKGYQVAGVAPPSFAGVFDQPVDAWIPPACLLSLTYSGAAGSEDPQLWRKVASFYVIAGAQSLPITDLTPALRRDLPRAENAEAPLEVCRGLAIDPVRSERLLHWLRLGFVLTAVFTLMSGLSYTILLLARTPSQAVDVQVKRGLGASPGRILIDSLIGPSAMVAGANLLAWGLSVGGLRILPGIFGAATDVFRGAWAYSLLSSSVAAVFSLFLTGLIGLVPAVILLHGSRANQTRQHTTTAGGRTVLFLDSVVTVQMVLSVVLAITAGMVLQSVLHLLRTPLGFETRRLSIIAAGPKDFSGGLTMSVDEGNPAKSSFPSQPAIREMLRVLASLPGAKNVAFAENVPLEDPPASSVEVELADGKTKAFTVSKNIVSEAFFSAMGIPLLQGSSVPANASRVVGQAVVNRTLAAELSPGGTVVGRSIRILDPAASGMPSFSENATIVGVAEDVRQGGPASSPEPTVYESASGAYFMNDGPYFVVNGIDPGDLPRGELAKTVSTLMPGLTVHELLSLRSRVQESMIPEEQRAGVVMALTAVISSLAFLGLAGSLSFYVATRRRDLAVRMCFGATPWGIRRLVLRRAAASGIAATLISMLSWPLLAHLSTNRYLGDASWSILGAVASTLMCLV